MGRPKGSMQTEETKRKISLALKGRIKSPETCKKLSESKKGRMSPMKGKHLSVESRLKMSLASKGKPKSPEHAAKIRALRLGSTVGVETRKKISFAFTGSKHPNWRGGISYEPYCVLFNDEFKERVRKFFGYICVECGKPQNGERLHIHHVNFDKQSCCNDTTPLFVPLCRSCHGRTQGNRQYWERHFTDMINLRYGGKCYIPRVDESCY
jgi:hypothetical protein